MSEYSHTGSTYAKLSDTSNLLESSVRYLTIYQFDFLVALVGFLIVRNVFPNALLGTQQNLRAGFVIAFFYAIFGLIRSGLNNYKKRLDVTSVGFSYY